jgi:phospho-N-acetylmuramoyl-pentapeptide-transferase
VISIFTAGSVAILVAGFGTPILLRFLIKRRIGQHVRADGPAGHMAKQGTPTMGGIAMLVGMVAGYVLGHIGSGAGFTRAGWLVVLAVLATGLIGAADDWIKVSRRRSLGLNKRAKAGLQFMVSVGFALAALYWAGINRDVSFTRYDVPHLVLPTAVYVLWCVIVIVGSSNAVNLTDGLDGLAAGSSAFAFSCLAIIGYWQFRHFRIYHVHDAVDLALVAVAMSGACVGFLWWNAAPARIIMGDTGSLAIGTGLACLGLSMNLDLLIAVIGGLFVVVTLSVVIQVFAFRVFHTRVFRMAPLHHHFELMGWPETTVVVRFWIFSGLCTALGLGLFYADFLSVGSVK